MPYFFFSISSEHNNVACPTTASVQELSSSSPQLTPRRKAKRRQKRKGKKKLEKKKEKQQHRHRMPSGVPEQESGCSLVQILVRILVILCTSFTLNMLVNSCLLLAFSLRKMYKAKLPQSLEA